MKHECPATTWQWGDSRITTVTTDAICCESRATGEAGVDDDTIVVQSQAIDLDMTWLLELARSDMCITGVVGWFDLDACDAPPRIAARVWRPKLRRLWPMLQNLPDEDWIVSLSLTRAVETDDRARPVL